MITLEHAWIPSITGETIATWGTWSKESDIAIHLVGPGLEGENFNETEPQQQALEAANQKVETMATEAGSATLIFVRL